ncbi:MAG: response regulator [Verrucomicrobiota bacterium]
MKKVLVAEDDFVVSKIYQLHFQRNRIHGGFFTDGAGVIASAKLERPDLVILDCDLPGLSGQEVMRQLRQIPGCEDLPVIFVTGRATPEVVETLRDGGAREVLGKPFSPLQLIQLIQRLTTP